MKGLFITFEGGEGAGKTSTLQALAHSMKEEGYDVVTTREPGGIDIAEKIRHIILDPSHTAMDGRTEALLYAAARRQHLIEKVVPALEEGKIVLCDRFVDSSLAYQGYARELGIEEVYEVNKFAIEDCMPDATLFFDISPEKGLERIEKNKGREQNRLDLEHIKFHHTVYEAYQMLIKKFPERISVVNADQPFEQVLEDVTNRMKQWIHADS